MIRRRDLPLEAAAHGLTLWIGSAFARTKGPLEKENAQFLTPIRPDERVNQILGPIRDEHHLAGLIGAILTADRLAAIGAVGIRKAGARDSIRVTDQMHLGSCTKAMTATMIGTLVDEKKLTTETTICEVFPKIAPKLHADFKAVTLWQLLTHSAGLPANGPWWQLSGETATEKRLDLLVRMLGKAPRSRPGSTFAYSNVGYALAGLMAEQVTGQSWETLMRRRLFEPLALNSAGFGLPGHPDQVDQPWGHHAFGKAIIPTRQDLVVPAMGPAGNVHCAIPDWAKFAALHLNGARGKAKLLKAATFRALHTPPPGNNNYAGGWVVVDPPWSGGRALTHDGSNLSWYSTISIAPARDFAVLVATNQGGASAAKACHQAGAKLIESRVVLTGQANEKGEISP